MANDYGRNNMYRNDEWPTDFVDMAADALGVEDRASAGMSVSTWADYDRDGHMDLYYVSNMFSAAGQP